MAYPVIGIPSGIPEIMQSMFRQGCPQTVVEKRELMYSL